MALNTRGYATASYRLNLNGVDVGMVRSFEGGDAYGEVVREQAGRELFVRKHLGDARYSEITLQFGLGLDRSVYEWVNGALRGDSQRKNGSVTILNQMM